MVSEAAVLQDSRSTSVGPRTMIAYGAPTFGYAFALFFIQLYFLKFATDVLLIAPALIGTLFALGRVWDAISDPLVGTLSDRTRSRFGRRKAWMLAGIPLIALFFVMVWSPPAQLGPAGTVVWSGFALFGFYTAYTIYTVPHYSLGAEITTDHHARSRVFGAHRIGFVLGMMVAFVALDRAGTAADPRAAATQVSLVGAVFIVAMLLITPTLIRERSDYQGRGADNAFRALRDVFRNPHARILFAAFVAEGLGAGVLGVLAPFVSEYSLKRPEMMAVLPIFYVIPSLISIPGWIALSHRMGKRNVWRIALLMTALGFGSTFFAMGSVPLLCTLMVLAGVGGGCGGAIGSSMLADVIDYDELGSGERKEGAYSAAWGFCFKLALGLTIGITGAALQISGFTPNQEQTRVAELTVRGLFAFFPLLGSLGAFFVIGRYSLDAAEHARIRTALDDRARRTVS